MIIFTGFEEDDLALRSLKQSFTIQEIPINDAIENDHLSHADVILLGPQTAGPVKVIQQVYATDKQLSVVLLALPVNIIQLKQSIQFAPFIGNNTLVTALHAELDLVSICKSAALRSRQKRSFNKIKIKPEPIAQLARTEKVKVEQLGNFLQHAPIAALVMNEDDEIINLNSKAKSLFTDVVKGNNHLNHLFPHSSTEKIKKFIHQPNGEQQIIVLAQQKHFELTASEVLNEEGQKHFLILVNDVTIQRQEAERIQSILEALPQMAWTADAAGKVDYLTKGWYSYTGQKENEALGEGWKEVIHVNDLNKLLKLWNSSLQSGKPLQQAAKFKNLKGEYRWHLIRAAAVKDKAGFISKWVGTCTDVHDQILLTEELERKVKERTRSLEETNAELEQFAHISSHDLQEPLRKIRTFTDILKRNSINVLNEQSVKYLDKISTTSERMAKFLNDLLNFTGLHEKQHFEVVDLNKIVNDILVDLELLISQKKASIEKDELPKLKAIPIQMQQLFYNLINNALKFSKKDVAPRITITSRQLLEEELPKYPQLHQYKKYYEIIVKDNGIGFEQQYAEKIFNIFQRLHTRTEFAGTGIGLSLVKKVVTNHKGEISVVSTPGEGAAFQVILPSLQSYV